MEIETVKKTETEGIPKMEKFRKPNRNYRGKLHQHNTRDRRKTLRC